MAQVEPLDMENLLQTALVRSVRPQERTEGIGCQLPEISLQQREPTKHKRMVKEG